MNGLSSWTWQMVFYAICTAINYHTGNVFGIVTGTLTLWSMIMGAIAYHARLHEGRLIPGPRGETGATGMSGVPGRDGKCCADKPSLKTMLSR